MFSNVDSNYDVILFGYIPINGYFLLIEGGILRKYQKNTMDEATTVDGGVKNIKVFNLYDEVWQVKETVFKLNY